MFLHVTSGNKLVMGISIKCRQIKIIRTANQNVWIIARSQWKLVAGSSAGNAGDQVAVGFSFDFDWLGAWHDFSPPIKERGEAKYNTILMQSQVILHIHYISWLGCKTMLNQHSDTCCLKDVRFMKITLNSHWNWWLGPMGSSVGPFSAHECVSYTDCGEAEEVES